MRNLVYFVTSNHGKYNEAKKLFEKENISLEWKKVSYPEIRSDDLSDIVVEGIKYLLRKYRNLKRFFIEDAGLFIHTLNGFPGQYSKFVYLKIGCSGILDLMKNKKDRKAYFKSVIGYYDGNIHIFEGICKGRIVDSERGTHGFGYDPIFSPKYAKKTFAEMTTEDKNKYSHRSIALRKLVVYLHTSAIR